MHKKRIIVIAIVAVAAVAGYYAFRSWRESNNQVIRVSGNIEMTEVTIGFKTAGRLLERTVDEGAAVKKGPRWPPFRYLLVPLQRCPVLS